MPALAQPLRPPAGSTLAGRYRLEEPLGRGQFSAVYAATDLKRSEPRALKVYSPPLSTDPDSRRRFAREARVTRHLHHPHAVRVFGYGSDGELLYLVMERLKGPTLRALLPEAEPPRLLAIAGQIADLLVAAHAIELVHRDLKPENVLVENDGKGSDRAVVVDFGLAFLRSASPSLGPLTEVPMLQGTPCYISPEQAQGASVGPSADIYSLGCMLYEMVTGAPPFVGTSSMGVINAHVFTPAPSLRVASPGLAVSPKLDALVLDMLDKRPLQRPFACEVRDRLRAI